MCRAAANPNCFSSPRAASFERFCAKAAAAAPGSALSAATIRSLHEQYVHAADGDEAVLDEIEMEFVDELDDEMLLSGGPGAAASRCLARRPPGGRLLYLACATPSLTAAWPLCCGSASSWAHDPAAPSHAQAEPR